MDPVDPVTPVDPVIPDTSTSVYDNGVTLDRGAKTLTFASLVVNGVTYTNTTFAITKQGDGYLLTAPDGKTLTVTGLKEANNTLVMQGSYGADNLFWSYNSAGAFTQASPDTKVISGDGQQKTVDGNSSAGAAGETGTIISGDKNKIDVPGDNSATGGGTATKVDGDGNEIANTGATSATGEGSTGVDVTGDKNKISNEGDSSATGGGTATKVTGDGNEIDSTGSTSAAGAGSTGVDVTGDANKINNEGASSATDGATGTKVAGNGNEITNTGDTAAASTDSSKPSTGVDVAGDGNTVNQNGKMGVGDYSTGMKVSGTRNTINLSSEEIKVSGQQATGVDVSGDANTVTLTGNMVVDKDQTSPLAAESFFTPSTGINVNGSNNTVVLDGHLQVIADTEVAGHGYGASPGTQETIQGLVVTGDNNRVDLLGGITLTGESDQLADATAGDAMANQRKGVFGTSVISVDGHSSVYISGDSRIEGEFGAGLALYSGCLTAHIWNWRTGRPLLWIMPLLIGTGMMMTV
ncbi:hypothetical protein C3436_22895 [Citrobacter amalonaticus]|nr:hypothetical protein C3436_22895 [Citrobacter amalonaticus]